MHSLATARRLEAMKAFDSLLVAGAAFEDLLVLLNAFLTVAGSFKGLRQLYSERDDVRTLFDDGFEMRDRFVELLFAELQQG